MMRMTAAMIAKANGGGTEDREEAARIVRKCMGDDGMPSLRRIYKELRKGVR